MTQQETKAVEDAAKTKTNEYCVSSDEVLSLKRSVIHDYLLSLFIAGAQFLDEIRKPSEPKKGSYNKVINVDINMDVVTLTNQQGDTFEFPNNEYHEGLVDFLFSYDVPSEPETNVCEAGKELVEKIELILNENRETDRLNRTALDWGNFHSVATEIASLLQHDNELLEALKHAKSLISLSSISDDAIINRAISNYEKQSK